jgi:5,10-methenyltetrahydrofolate synthetase
MSDKRQLRESFKAIRKSISAQEKLLHEKSLCQKIQSKINAEDARKIALYYPKRSEFNILNITAALDSKELIFLLPRISGDLLNFHLWQQGDQLQLDNKFGIYQPNQDSKIYLPDLIFVPLLAFDKHNNRLGYGGGFYDRVIRKLREEKANIKFIGVGHSKLTLQEVPVEEHDEKLDAVIY